jgi:hypothetical protein
MWGTGIGRSDQLAPHVRRGHSTPGSEEIVLGREDARRGSRRDAKLHEDVLDVPGDGSLADHERACNLAIAPAAGDQTEHLELARGEAVLASSPLPGERVEPREVGRRSQPEERVASGVQLERSRIAISELRAGVRDEDACAGGVVGRVQVLPRLPSAAKRRQRGSWVTLGQRNGAFGLRG